MGQLKKWAEEKEQQREWGKQIAIDAGVLKVCKFHEKVYYDGEDKTPAYKLGNYKFSKGDLKEQFSDRTEMTDAIKEAIEEAALSCWVCDKVESDD